MLLALKKPGLALLPDVSQVLCMRGPVHAAEEAVFLAVPELRALPAAVVTVLPRAVPDLARGVAAACLADFIAAQANHLPQYLVALWVLLECLEVRNLRQRARRLVEPHAAKLLAQVARQVGYLAGMVGAFGAVEAAVGDCILVLGRHERRTGARI